MPQTAGQRPPLAAIGMPLYQGGPFLREALESLLAQTCGDFLLVATDDSGESAQEFAAYGDDRLRYERNAERLGLVGNWRRAHERAMRLSGGAPYFAWASDHDTWEPTWLERLVGELEGHPEAVLAYGVSGPWRFETRGDPLARRFARTLRRMVAGDMVYGVFRADTLTRAGVYRRVLLPDRLLLAELALQGEFVQVPAELWHRRSIAGSEYSLERQRASIFLGAAPVWSRLPWWLMHAAAIAWAHGVRGEGSPGVTRLGGLLAAAGYAALAPAYGVARRLTGQRS